MMRLKHVLRKKPSIFILIYLDFDGTLNHLNGEATYNSPLYLLLLANEHLSLKSQDPVFKPKDEMIRILREEWRKAENKSMKLREGALAFLQKLLNNKKASVYIVSLNYKEYIEAVLNAAAQEAGVELTHQSRLNIVFANPKGPFVAQEIQKKGPAAVTLVCDDSPEHLRSMVAAVAANAPKTTLLSYSTDFNWPAMGATLERAIVARKSGVAFDEKKTDPRSEKCCEAESTTATMRETAQLIQDYEKY